MKKLWVAVGILLISLNSYAEERNVRINRDLRKETDISKKYKIESPKKNIRMIRVENPYEWKSFQDAQIVQGWGREHNQVHLLFAVRKGYPLSRGNTEEMNIGLWLGSQDNDARWHSHGVIQELNDFFQGQVGFRPSGVANRTADVMTACVDHAKYQHVFIHMFKMMGMATPEYRLAYVKRSPEGRFKVKLSQSLQDDMGHTMRCVADSTNTIHLFGSHLWSADYSKIAHYKLDWNEQERRDKFFTMTRSELPPQFETSNFAIWNSGHSLDLLYNLRNNVPLSLARHQFEQGQFRNVASAWRVLNDNNALPENNPHVMRDRQGFSFGSHKRAHVLGRFLNRGIGYYHQDDNGHWRSNGIVLSRNLSSFSATALETRPIFHLAGVTSDAQVWYGYYNYQEQRWVDQGIIFNRETK